MKNQLLNSLLILGYILLIAGAILWFNAYQWSNYIFTLGALCYALPKLFTLPESDHFRVKRLNMMVFVAILLLGVSVYFMWVNKNSWVLTLTIAIFIDLFTSFRYPKENNPK